MLDTGATILVDMTGQRERLKVLAFPGLHSYSQDATVVSVYGSAQRGHIYASHIITHPLAEHLIERWYSKHKYHTVWVSLEHSDKISMANYGVSVQGAHRKMLDALNSIGLSDSLLRVIERRQFLDKLIVYGGMVSNYLLSTVFDEPKKWQVTGVACSNKHEICTEISSGSTSWREKMVITCCIQTWTPLSLSCLLWAGMLHRVYRVQCSLF